MSWIPSIANFLQSITLTVFADWKVTGRENVPPFGPLIIVANHQSNFDPTLISTSLPRRISFLAKKGIFVGPVATWFFRQYGAFPLDREGADVRAYRWALGQLGRDRAIVIFPEGTRTRGGMRRAQPGVARLALKAQAALLPVGITGTERLGSWLRVFSPTGKIRANIGVPFTLPAIEGRPSREVMESLTDMIMGRIAVLLPPEYRGVYSVEGRVAAPGEET